MATDWFSGMPIELRPKLFWLDSGKIGYVSYETLVLLFILSGNTNRVFVYNGSLGLLATNVFYCNIYRRWFVFINCNICTTGQARFLLGFSRLNGIFFFVVYMCSIFVYLRTVSSILHI